MKSIALALLIGLLSLGIPLCAQSSNADDRYHGQQVAKLSSDCTIKELPQGFSRIFIAFKPISKPADSHANPSRPNASAIGHEAGSGTANDPYDGSTAQKFDGILRSRSEALQQNLIVCIGPGTFETEGTYDFIVNVPHKTARGFTLNTNWKVHGAGVDRTILKLVSFFGNPSYMAKGTGAGVVLSTYNDAASGIEISDLTIDNNYSELKPVATQQGITGLNLEAIHLRSDEGGHWIHRVKVIHTAGEVSEVFPIWIVSMSNQSPSPSSGNIIEYVTLRDQGAGACTAIAITNAMGEVRNNEVNGYEIGYGAWSIGKVAFHDNTAIDTKYGFNIDSGENDGVRIYNNQIIHPRRWGMVFGGGKRYANFEIVGNTIQINNKSAIGILFQGNVTNALLEKNNFIADPPASTHNFKSISSRGHGNQGNIERSNQVLTGNGQPAIRPGNQR
jgi:hypothetical protein